MPIIVRGMVSLLFPQTFTYVQKFFTAKYGAAPKDLPDIEVVLKSKTILWGTAHYNRYTKKIVVNISRLLNDLDDSVKQKLLNNTQLLCAFIDTRNNMKIVLIHEYQHYLQHLYGRKRYLKTHIPASLSLKDAPATLAHRISALVGTSAMFGLVTYGLKGMAAGVVLNVTYQRLFAKLAPELSLRASREMRYAFSPREVEAQLSELVYYFYIGYAQGYVVTNSQFSKSLEKLQSDLEVIREGLKEQEEQYTTFKRMNEKEFNAYLAIRKTTLTQPAKKIRRQAIKLIRWRIDNLKKQILVCEKTISLHKSIITEAHRLAHQLQKEFPTRFAA